MFLVAQRRVAGSRKHESCLARTGTPGNDQKVGGLQAAQELVQVVESGGRAHHLIAALRDQADAVIIIAQYLLDRLQVAGHAPLRDTENCFLGFVHYNFQPRVFLVSQLGNAVSSLDHPTTHGSLLNHVPIGLSMQRGRHIADQGGQVSRSAHLSQLTGTLKFLRHCQEVDWAALLVQAHKGFPHPAMAVDIKIIPAQELGNVVISLRIDQHRAQQRLFSFSALGH